MAYRPGEGEKNTSQNKRAAAPWQCNSPCREAAAASSGILVSGSRSVDCMLTGITGTMQPILSPFLRRDDDTLTRRALVMWQPLSSAPAPPGSPPSETFWSVYPRRQGR